MALILADARYLPLRDACVQCVVTSPPYWGLRDYGTATWDGGDPTCAHAGTPKPRQDTSGSTQRFAATRGTQASKAVSSIPVRGVCACGAVRVDQQIGLEATPDAYVATLVEVFREVRRVLKDDGTIWLNLGDSYISQRGQAGGVDPKQPARRHGLRPQDVAIDGLKPKDLVGIPWRVAFALQADGWYLRSEVIWHKPNPMPESVGDRPTLAHERVFLLTKNARYFYDAAAIKEPASGTAHARGNGVNPKAGKNETSGDRTKDGFNNKWRAKQNASFSGAVSGLVDERNKRSVWTIPSEPYPGAHYAVMPQALVRPCILAGSRIGDLVLDPFIGSGTVGVVAERFGRRWVGTDLNAEYQQQAARRTAQRGLLSRRGSEAE